MVFRAVSLSATTHSGLLPVPAKPAAGHRICQSACKVDPGSASKIDPMPCATVSARPGGAGRGCATRSGAGDWLSALALRAVLEAPGFVPGLDDLAVMGEAIE